MIHVVNLISKVYFKNQNEWLKDQELQVNRWYRTWTENGQVFECLISVRCDKRHPPLNLIRPIYLHTALLSFLYMVCVFVLNAIVCVVAIIAIPNDLLPIY